MRKNERKKKKRKKEGKKKKKEKRCLTCFCEAMMPCLPLVENIQKNNYIYIFLHWHPHLCMALSDMKTSYDIRLSNFQNFEKPQFIISHIFFGYILETLKIKFSTLKGHYYMYLFFTEYSLHGLNITQQQQSSLLELQERFQSENVQ